MNAYVDSSVILRIALGEPGRLASWRRIASASTSELCRVECYRVIDRMRLGGEADDDEVARVRTTIDHLLTSIELVPLDRRILRRAQAPMPTTLGTLDAIHVATAVALRRTYPTLCVATHDDEMSTAARAIGFRVLA